MAKRRTFTPEFKALKRKFFETRCGESSQAELCR